MLVIRQLTVAIGNKNTMEVNLVTNILQNIFICVQQKKEKGLQHLEGK